MSKQFRSRAILLIVFGLGIGVGLLLRRQMKNPEATIPLERAFEFFVREGRTIDEDLLYHDVGLLDFIIKGSAHTKVAVDGIVEKVTREPDGDVHILIRPPYSPSPILVTEVMPEIPLPLPAEGDHIKIWGITRFDELHDWWELHPVVGWKKLEELPPQRGDGGAVH